MEGIYLLLGTNLGDRAGNLKKAINLIQKEIGNVIMSSRIYETESWGVENNPKYLNQVIEISTKLSPQELLSSINTIEKKLGRKRIEKWQSRIIDIDILFYNDQFINSDSLTIPHPEIKNRMFTLIPLEELAGEEIFPGKNSTIREILTECQDTLEVKIYTP